MDFRQLVAFETQSAGKLQMHVGDYIDFAVNMAVSDVIKTLLLGGLLLRVNNFGSASEMTHADEERDDFSCQCDLANCQDLVDLATDQVSERYSTSCHSRTIGITVSHHNCHSRCHSHQHTVTVTT